MATLSKNKMRISITIFPFVNTLLEKASRQSGMSKSAFIENALKAFLRKKLDKDSKALAKLSFKDLPKENQWLSLESSLED